MTILEIIDQNPLSLLVFEVDKSINLLPAEGRERAKPVYRYLILTNLYCLKKPKSLYFQRFSDFSSFLKRFNLHVEAAEKLYFLYVFQQLFIFC